MKQIVAFLAFLSWCTCIPFPGTGYRPTSVCFEKIGCFSFDGTFKGIMKLLPEVPEVIDTRFKLLTKHNKQVSQEISYAGALPALLDPNVATVFVVHGFATINNPEEWYVTQAFLENIDCQVIVVDWRGGSQPPAYWQAAVNSELVGRQIGLLAKTLVDKMSFRPDMIHVYGTSLGAHVAGFVGKWTKSQYGFTIGRISASDPAGPYFEDASDTVHLSSKDATFVDVIHSSAGRNMFNGEVGMIRPIGHVDFYPNGGTLQPGCKVGDPICSHLRADELYSDSLKNLKSNCSFKSYPCPGGYDAFTKGLCRDCGSAGCSRLGFLSVNSSGRGKQFLDTNAISSFCKE